MNKSQLLLKIPALKISQREGKKQAIYLAKVKAKDFFIRTKERFKIDFYERDIVKGDIGYQRQLNDKNVDKIKDFVLKETPNPLLPTAILASSRDVIEFKEKKGGFGTLIIKDVLYIIDGQHRFRAWEDMMKDSFLREEWGNYEFPIVILSGFKYNSEVGQFYIINSRQKRIKTDLAHRHLLQLKAHKETSGLVSEKDLWKLRATKVIDVLNEEIDGIWKGKIILPCDGPELRKTKIIGQASFVASLKPFFVGGKAIFDITGENIGRRLNEWASFLTKFWNIVGDVYPEAIKTPHEYVLMKTVGVSSLHKFLHDEFFRAGPEEDKKEVFDKIRRILTTASQGNYPQEFWRSQSLISATKKATGRYASAYSSGAGHSKLAYGIATNGVV